MFKNMELRSYLELSKDCSLMSHSFHFGYPIKKLKYEDVLPYCFSFFFTLFFISTGWVNDPSVLNKHSVLHWSLVMQKEKAITATLGMRQILLKQILHSILIIFILLHIEFRNRPWILYLRNISCQYISGISAFY